MLPTLLVAQKWQDTTHNIQTEKDITYSAAVDFAGAEKNLLMDISTPIGDAPPKCGRPLAIIVHGGAWLAGSKDDPNIRRMGLEFAKRGYVTATINYRLGMFHTDENIHCNLENWDCFNVTDSSEWYRAYFRAVQDVNTAIRYMLTKSEEYNIDPNNVFLIGESAGAYTVIGAGYIDAESEVMTQHTAELPDALTPNTIYESPCIQQYGLAESIEAMDLAIPDLGNYKGNQYLQNIEDYDIKAVGAFYGGVFNNIFLNNDATKPSLYMFHQPNDLIVPVNYNKIFQGYAACSSGFPTNCQNIINRVQTWGSGGVNNMLDTISAVSLTNIDYKYIETNNNAPCLEQVANPSKGGHQLDNYWLRSSELAEYFADRIADCKEETSIENNNVNTGLHIYPNPIESGTNTTINSVAGQLQITDVYGNVVVNEATNGRYSIANRSITLGSGVYFIKVMGTKVVQIGKIIVQK